MDVAMHHGHNLVLDPIAIAVALASDQHLEPLIGAVTGSEGVGAVNLLERTTNAVNRHLPELRCDRFLNLCIIDALNLGLQISTNLKTTLNGAIALLPDAATLIPPEPGFPGVAVLIGSAKGIAAITAWSDILNASDGHGEMFELPRHYRG